MPDDQSGDVRQTVWMTGDGPVVIESTASGGRRQVYPPVPDDDDPPDYVGAVAACPTPSYHRTHRYCPSCAWTEQGPLESIPPLKERATALVTLAIEEWASIQNGPGHAASEPTLAQYVVAKLVEAGMLHA